MNKKTFIGGTFAAVAAIVAASSFISCSSDDEYYENGNYTLANQRMSRSPEMNIGAGRINGGTDTYTTSNSMFSVTFEISWGTGTIGQVRASVSNPNVSVLSNDSVTYKDDNGKVHKAPKYIFEYVSYNNHADFCDGEFVMPGVTVYYGSAKVTNGKEIEYNKTTSSLIFSYRVDESYFSYY